MDRPVAVQDVTNPLRPSSSHDVLAELRTPRRRLASEYADQVPRDFNHEQRLTGGLRRVLGSTGAGRTGVNRQQKGSTPHRARQSSLFIPSSFDNKLETFTDHSTGVTFQAAYDEGSTFQPPKVLKYDVAKILSGPAPWRALLSSSKTHWATALSTNKLWEKVSTCVGLSVAFALLGSQLEQNVEDAAASLNSLIAGGLFFLLGPYTTTAVSRYWEVRKDCIGALWGAIDDLACWSAAWHSSSSSGDCAARDLVLRLGLCSHALLYKQARCEDGDLSDLSRAGLLTDEELDALRPLPSKAQVVWSWLSLFFTKALGGELDCTVPPGADQLMPLVMDKCMHGRGAIGKAMTFIDTQQPFPYVHLLSVCTDVALVINATTVGIQTGRQLASTAHCNTGTVQSSEHCFAAVYDHSPLSIGLLVLIALGRVAALTLFADGLLGIGVALDNPLGDDQADLPGLAYQLFMRDECKAFGDAVDAVDFERGWWRGLSKIGTRQAVGDARTTTSTERGIKKGENTLSPLSTPGR